MTNIQVLLVEGDRPSRIAPPEASDGGIVMPIAAPIVRELAGLATRLGFLEIEERLRENENLLWTIFTASPECMKVISPDGIIMQINPAGLAMVGAITPEAVIGSSIYPMIAERDRERFRQHMETVMGGAKDAIEYEAIGWDATRLWIESTAVPLTTSSTEIVGVLAIARDVTARKEAEKLQRATYRIAEAAGSAPTLERFFATVHRLIQNVMEAQNFSITLFDRKTGEMSVPFFSDEDEARPPSGGGARELSRYVLRTGKSLLCDAAKREDLIARGEIEADGPQLAIWLGVPLAIEGTTIGVMSVQHYLNPHAYSEREQKALEYVSTQVASAIDRKRSDARLRQSEEQFRLIAESVHDLIAVVDLQGKRTYNSPSYRQLLGDPEELRGTDSFQEIHPEDRERIRRVFEETVKTGRGQRADYRFIAKNGEVRFIESQGSVIRDAKGTVINIVIVSRDVTEQRMVEQQSLRAQRLESIGTLAGGIAHDLNNVLAPIVLSLEVLGKMLPDAQSRHILQSLQEGAQRGANLVKQVLSFARGVDGERTLVQPRYLVQELEKIIRQTFPKSISLSTEVPTSLWSIIADATQVHQVLLNLCVNARDAMTDGGRLTLAAENICLESPFLKRHPGAKAGPHVLLTITDTGAGMTPEVMDRMFEPFFTTKAPGKGTGIGLSTVMAIVKGHEGFIDVLSEPAKGTTFRVYLPASLAPAAASPAAAVKRLPQGMGETILVVDDEFSIREITCATLHQFGYKVLLAGDGAEAVTLFAEKHAMIDIVLTDIAMPLLEGAALIKALHDIDPAVKIIASSGFAPGEMVPDRGMVTASLVKPYTAGQLLSAIAETLAGTEPAAGGKG